ncbi:MAG: hypothetical protein KDD41_12770 [Flavobacteriales bacterium]|nr:hypothetical protein [Flavobacteriales bacterium]
MRNVTKIVGMAALILTTTAANAQFNKLKDAAKGKAKEKAAEKVLNKKDDESTNSGNSTSTSTSSNTPSAAPAAAEKPLDLDYNTFNLTPAVTMNSLLYGTIVYTGGSTRLESYTASFVPYKKTDGSVVNTVYDQSKYLKVKVYKGTEFIDYFEYDGSTTFDNNKLRKFNAPTSRYKKNGDWADGTNIDLKKWGEGTYRLEFFAGEKLFYNFEFEVYKVTNDDPYASVNEMYLSRGPWNKYVYLEHQESGNMIFGVYMMHEVFQPDPANANKTTKDVNWTVNITKDGKPFAKHYNMDKPKVSKVERGEWKAQSTALKSADGKKTIQLADFTDGAYKIELKLDTEDKPRTYSFSVANNKIVLMDEQDRTKNTDPTRLVEGWNNFFWFKQEN